MPKSKPTAFSWTQPCCIECWNAIKLKTGRIHDKPGHYFCTYCRVQVDVPTSHVYMVRVNPGTVPYPTIKKEEDQ